MIVNEVISNNGKNKYLNDNVFNSKDYCIGCIM